jgi:PAS domain S-box-containing protein
MIVPAHSTQDDVTPVVPTKAADMARELSTMLDWAPGFICILKGPQHVVEFVNRSHRKLFHSAGWVGKPARVAIPEATAQGFHDILDTVFRTGERFVGTDLPVRYRPTEAGPEMTLYHDFVYEPIRDGDGRITGVFCEGLDVTSAHEAREELQRHVERQSFRLEFERTVANGASAHDAMTTAARLLAARWSAGRLVLTERAPGIGDKLCRRTFCGRTGRLEEEAVEDFPFDDTDLARLAAGTALLRPAGAHHWEVAVPRLAGTGLVATVEIAFAGDLPPADCDVALLEDLCRRRLWETVDRIRAEAERDRFFDASLDLLCIASLDDGRIRRASRSFADILGWDPDALVGMASLDLVHPDDRRAAKDMAPSLEHGGRLRGFEQRIRSRDGSYRWISWSTTPVPEENLLYGVGRDVTDRKAFDRQRDIFIAELNHRVKNTLAVVQAMASQTFRAEGGDPSRAIAKYQKRIAAVASAHDLLTDNDWGPVLLGDLVRSVVLRAALASRQIEAEGPDLHLSPRQAVAASLALNELIENARVHGALSVISGSVAIRWTLDGGDRFSLAWQETGGPAPDALDLSGFGTQFLRSLGDEFDGESRLEYGDHGFEFRLIGRLPD